MVPLHLLVSLLLVLKISTFLLNKQVGDKNGRILILDGNIDEIKYGLVKMCNANTKVKQVQDLSLAIS